MTESQLFTIESLESTILVRRFVGHPDVEPGGAYYEVELVVGERVSSEEMSEIVVDQFGEMDNELWHAVHGVVPTMAVVTSE